MERERLKFEGISEQCNFKSFKCNKQEETKTHCLGEALKVRINEGTGRSEACRLSAVLVSGYFNNP